MTGRPRNRLTDDELQALAQEWSTECVEFKLWRNPEPTELRRRVVLDARQDTPAGQAVWSPSPPGFRTTKKARDFATNLAQKERRQPKLMEWRGR